MKVCSNHCSHLAQPLTNSLEQGGLLIYSTCVHVSGFCVPADYEVTKLRQKVATHFHTHHDEAPDLCIADSSTVMDSPQWQLMHITLLHIHHHRARRWGTYTDADNQGWTLGDACGVHYFAAAVKSIAAWFST